MSLCWIRLVNFITIEVAIKASRSVKPRRLTYRYSVTLQSLGSPQPVTLVFWSDDKLCWRLMISFLFNIIWKNSRSIDIKPSSKKQQNPLIGKRNMEQICSFRHKCFDVACTAQCFPVNTMIQTQGIRLVSSWRCCSEPRIAQIVWRCLGSVLEVGWMEWIQDPNIDYLSLEYFLWLLGSMESSLQRSHRRRTNARAAYYNINQQSAHWSFIN